MHFDNTVDSYDSGFICLSAANIGEMEIDKQPKKPTMKKPSSQFSYIFVCNDHVTQVWPIKTIIKKKNP